jgi:DHA2 family multidrug resistance protein
VLHHARLAEQINPYNPLLQPTLASQAPAQRLRSLALLDRSIGQQGFQIAFNEIFHVLGWIFIGLIAVLWLARPPFHARNRAAAAAEAD